MWGFDKRSGESIDHSTDASCRPEHLYSHCFGCHFCTCLLIYAAYSHQTLFHALLLALALPDKHCSSSSSFYTFPCPALFAPPLLHILEPSSFLCLSFCLLCPTSSSSYTLPTACANFSASFLFHLSFGALASTSCFPSPAIVSIFAESQTLAPPLLLTLATGAVALPSVWSTSPSRILPLVVARSCLSAHPGLAVPPYDAGRISSSGRPCGACQAIRGVARGFTRAPAPCATVTPPLAPPP